MSDEREARMALGVLVEPGSRELGLLVRAEGAPVALDCVLRGVGVTDYLAGAVRARLASAGLTGAPDVVARIVEGMTERADRLGARIVTAADDEWPAALDDLVSASREGNMLRRDTDPPLALWIRGAGRLVDVLERSVSVVGARSMTSYGEFVASEFAYGLAQRGWTVVSGGALGVDVTAHRGTLAAGGLTVAVLACGIDRNYPAANATVLERIAEEGLLLTEWPPGTNPHKTRFLTRNRVIAAATRGTVVVEAGSRSGARNTLAYARLLRRSAMVVPGPITSAMSIGCHVELRVPGTVPVTRVEEIIEEVGAVGELADPIQGAGRPEDVLDPLQARILDAVPPRRPRTAEEVAAVAGVSGREARRNLPLLEELGFVVRGDAGYRLATGPDVPRPPEEG
ncbi:DNA-processing protein DprA [Dactylosporangium sp. AC04546]|uniref:DNA-processing protein DprA n=1 Tax=Dactylosporangium sp. AC04546 TaxID=2862460 RepID=UPI001EE00AE3|nr:DNA-processing protein DprA [Dactylosporangium sp. AC04546]WVK85266.1 DNA-processing protein DprA [Dactylosporangium sp. AC04546]